MQTVKTQTKNKFSEKKDRMKKIVSFLLTLLLCAALCVPALADPSAGEKPATAKATMSLADARGKIDRVIESSHLMKEVMQQLSAEDQKEFLADAMKAIGDMPGSVEEKTANWLNTAHAAVVSAQKGNTVALLAEVFATVPPEALTVINERFAIDLMSRNANPNVMYTDEQYTKIAVEAMKTINERTEETDDGSSRSTFAILMFLRASGLTGTALANLEDALVETLKHDDAKDLAKDEWIPAALGLDGREQRYEPLLASADSGRQPDFAFTLVIAGPQYLESVLEEIVGRNTDKMSFIQSRSSVLDAVENPSVHITPPFSGSILSDGNLWIIIAAAVVALAGAAALVIVKKRKKKPATAGGTGNTDEE